MTEPDRLHLILMAGLPGSGKSTLAQVLGQRLNWPVIDKDVLLSAMLETIPEAGAQPASYAGMFALGRDMLVNQRCSVILDSPALWNTVVDTAGSICHEAGAELRVILCLAEQNTRNTRVRSRIAQRSQPVGVSRTVGTGIERFSHLPKGTLNVMTELDLETNVSQVIQCLGRHRE